ncbi:hypothetical protein BO70DRAFT_8865 [Aspergillus heteromorphus CBS 117.55]|uniref:Uncharacterized protein n=1 Tax=Aspergillus heteromorphus CBS 117.55 TaxID=1448321 RepID=A0A317X653_9EURO|nr:uncharacterized protein BO70DRAFT_8865 [Aspergillus heteromorphus CBS 117.55]PWY92388.1 hypothetical protein BO70DRAFT_8865 [Aspergillus heteromorphus CBS 117.55]
MSLLSAARVFHLIIQPAGVFFLSPLPSLPSESSFGFGHGMTNAALLDFAPVGHDVTHSLLLLIRCGTIGPVIIEPGNVINQQKERILCLYQVIKGIP